MAHFKEPNIEKEGGRSERGGGRSERGWEGEVREEENEGVARWWEYRVDI